ncbi:MAG: rRNA cytosine-C5-methyltransferase, partial [Paramuribaculum sp.]|nr:rRNA cytosine-C5-methyltransferase [Paramuribaculum sp.]
MALPQEFVDMIEGYRFPPFSGLADTLQATAPEVSVRLNPEKNTVFPSAASPVAWWQGGFYLPERGSFTFDPQLHQGRYYVQDAASMFIAHIARVLAGGEPVRWLDACAAPGGKTTAVLDALPQGSVVVANEFVRTRADILRENLAKWGKPDVKVTNADTKIFRKYSGLFHVVAADVPCSGEGMMRKDPEAVAQWSPGLVESCARRQREIVENLWTALAPGGYFVYSTCTFNRTENEEMVQWMIDEFGAIPVDIPVEQSWGISPGINVDFPCYRFIPGVTRGEGLFIAVLRKPHSDSSPQKTKSKSKQRKAVQPKTDIRGWLLPDAQIEFLEDKDKVFAVSTTPLALEMPEELRPAMEIAVIKGRDLIPTQQLAMSTILSPDSFRSVQVDRLTALQYLRCEALKLPDDTPKGFTLLKYNGAPLGFVKNLGNRANNLYPAEWRI